MPVLQICPISGVSQVVAAVVKADKGEEVAEDDIKPQSSSCVIL